MLRSNSQVSLSEPEVEVKVDNGKSKRRTARRIGLRKK
jgi:hypothetical protein